MDTNFENSKKQIIEKLQKKVTNFECPVCKNKEFMLVGGYFAHDLQEDLNNRRIGGINIPTVPLICKNCGYIAEFAAGNLGLLPKVEDKKQEKKNG
jgi:DNA-directed RNA polymerase subunit M/transcription elongation factor TFIIS